MGRLILVLLCGPVLFINLTKEPWSRIDYDNAEHATKRCGEIYPNSPCLKKFIKVRTQMYRAICGKDKKD